MEIIEFASEDNEYAGIPASSYYNNKKFKTL